MSRPVTLSSPATLHSLHTHHWALPKPAVLRLPLQAGARWLGWVGQGVATQGLRVGEGRRVPRQGFNGLSGCG